MRSIVRTLGIGCALFCTIIPAHAKVECSSARAQKAENAVEKIENWSDLSSYVVDYRECDDGFIAEGSSEKVSKLVIDRWKEIIQLNKLPNGKSILKFVYNHINSTLSTTDLENIKLQAKKCIINDSQICSSMMRSAQQALR